MAQSSDLAIVHVTVINPGSGQQPDGTVIIHGDHIVSVSPHKIAKIPGAAQVVDGTGKFLIPGLWDMHVHFRGAQRDLKMDVANGVLGIRNMGGAGAEVYPLREKIAQGQLLGPKIVASGAIVDGPDSFSNPEFTVSVRTPEEAREAVRAHKKEDADFIKVYDGLSHDAYFAIIDEAKRQSIPVAGHLPAAIGAREASNAGQRTLEHGMPLAAGSTMEREYLKWGVDRSVFNEALRTKNFVIIPEKIARDNTAMLDHFQQPLADDAYRVLAKNNTFLTPTLVTQRSLTFIDDLVKKPDSRMEYVSDEELNWWKPENGMLTKYRTPEYIAMRKRQYAKMMEQIPKAQALGVRFLAGTDITIPYTYPGFSLHDELKLFVDAGMTTMQALETATTNPALLLGLSKTWGKIEPGYIANLVLLNANPLVDIQNTQKIDGVVVNGKLLDRTRLDQLLTEAKVKK
ncbi:MAG TPA: amidohydrolase family protein [Candidatus Acidoferrum sp.]